MLRVPGTRDILSSYVMAPVNFSEISGKQLLGTREILRPLLCGTRGLLLLKRVLHSVYLQGGGLFCSQLYTHYP